MINEQNLPVFLRGYNWPDVREIASISWVPAIRKGEVIAGLCPLMSGLCLGEGPR